MRKTYTQYLASYAFVWLVPIAMMKDAETYGHEWPDLPAFEFCY